MTYPESVGLLYIPDVNLSEWTPTTTAEALCKTYILHLNALKPTKTIKTLQNSDNLNVNCDI